MSKGTHSCYPLSAIRYPLLTAAAVMLMACSPKGEALYQRAQQALDKGDARAAVIDLKNLVKDEPENAKARALLAAALAENGEIGAAAIEVQKAKDLGAPEESLLVPECRVMAAQSEFDAALEKCQPDAVAADYKPTMQIVQGQALLGLDRAAEAKPQFEAALATRPDSLDALLGLASAMYAMDGLPGAKAVLEGASPAIQERPQYWMAMGGLSSQAGDFAGAEKSYQKALDSVGEGNKGGAARLMAMGALAEAQMRQGKVDEATATAAQLAKAAPNNPLVQQLRGQVAAAGGNLDEARTLLEEAVAAMPDNYEARTLLGIVNAQQGNLGQAEMHFQSVLANQPGNVRAQRLLAETRAKLQTPEEALASLKPALSAADADPGLLAMAGRMSLASGDREQALAYFQQAAAQTAEQTPSDVQLELAGGYLAAGDLDRAVEVLEKMPAGGADEMQREYMLLAALLRKGENDKAVAEAESLVARRGDDVQARNLAAGVFAAAGRPADAREQFAAALKLKPDDAVTLLNIGYLDLADSKPGDAARSFQKVLDTDKTNMRATVGLAIAANAQRDTAEAEKWLKKASADHPQSAEVQIALAQFYMGSRDFGRAKAVLEESRKAMPENAALSNALGLAQMGLNDTDGAMASFKKAWEQAPQAYGYAMNLARAHLAARDPGGALDVIDRVLKEAPKLPVALALGGATAINAGQMEKATGYVERLRQAAPDSAGTYVLEGDLAMAQKRYRDALGHYRRANGLAPNSQVKMAQYRAALLAGEPRPEMVLEDWVAKNPADANAVAVLAARREAAGNVKGAIDLYEAGLAVAPDSAMMLNNVAVLYSETGDSRAGSYAERAYKAAPTVPAIADTYGWILFKQGKTDEALRLLREAANGLPDNAEVQYHLGAALAKSGEKAAAVEALRKAVAGALPDRKKAEADKLLEQLAK